MDRKSRFGAVFPTKNKSPSNLDTFLTFKVYVETQTQRKIKCVRVNGAKELVDGDFRRKLNELGIHLEQTAAHSSAQNGIPERSHCTLADHSRCMLIEYDTAKSLWPEAFRYANYLKNHSPTKALGNRTPYEAFFGRKPDVSGLREFGTKCWVLQQDGKNHKLQPRGRPMLFVGLGKNSTAWRYYNPKTHQVLLSQNVIFEDGSHSRPSASLDLPTLFEGEECVMSKQVAADPPAETETTKLEPDKTADTGRVLRKR